MNSLLQLVLITLVLLQVLTIAKSHGCVNTPNQRGSLTARTDYIFRTINSASVVDFHPHFPAGKKINRPLAGVASQRAAAGPAGWVPYEPLRRGFKWRAGVCGDEINGPQRHMAGGEFYNNGEIVATYPQGGILSVGLSISAHHNGFMELFICDVNKCGGEISPECFTSGNCRQLERAPNPICDGGLSRWCGPIDRNYRGRFYLPPTRYYGQDGKVERFGADENGDTILYQLPDMYCEHCVLQWYWTSANLCNPPGLIEYFNGPDRPRGWGRLPGQGGAIGGVARGQKTCGGRNRFPEEYLQCIDIRITQRGAASRRGPTDMKPVSPGSGNTGGHLVSEDEVEQARKMGSGPIRIFMLVADGKRIAILKNKRQAFDARGWNYVTVEAITNFGVPYVEFTINGKRGGTARGPNFQPVNSRRWLPFNQWNSVSAHVWADTDFAMVLLRK